MKSADARVFFAVGFEATAIEMDGFLLPDPV